MASGDSTVDPAAATVADSDPDLELDAGPAIGRFLVGGVLGQGGMGVVMRARDPELGRDVAIKLLQPGQRGLAGLRLGREAQAMAKLSHPNVVNVYDVGEHDGAMYIAMELVEGSTLRAWRQAATRTWREVLAMYVAAGRGLAAAHAAGLVHRDFKPDNVLVGADGRPRVTDFGLVAADGRAVESGDTRGAALDANLTVQGSVLGTPAYMAPEQWRGETVDPRTDQFAFCVALWEALHGERPFEGETTAVVRQAILDGAPVRRGSACRAG